MAKNILIVDDSGTMRKIVMRGIRPAGIDNIDCTAAGDGAKGMQASEGSKLDLILADVDTRAMHRLAPETIQGPATGAD